MRTLRSRGRSNGTRRDRASNTNRRLLRPTTTGSSTARSVIDVTFCRFERPQASQDILPWCIERASHRSTHCEFSCCELSRCEPVEARVRSIGVVVDPPFFDDLARLFEVGKQVRHSSRRRPLKLSTKPFCIGLPGAM